MRRFSHIPSFLAFALFLLCVGSVAEATPIDPEVILDGGGSCPGTQLQTSLTQAFRGLQTGCTIDFRQLIGESVILHTLVVNVTSPFDGQISCINGESSPLKGTPVVSSPRSCTFSDPPTSPGSIGFDQTYSLFFGTNFGPTVDIILAQEVIPEPATLLLVGTGLLALVANRKRLNALKDLV
jgi:PEP-CTERM motif